MHFRFAEIDDCPLLGELNHQLVQDEGHRNPMTVAQLAERMAAWLAGEYRAVMFEDAGTVVGYALYRTEPEYIYLRQLFVRSERRRRGIGRQALEWLRQNAWRDARRVRIDVLVDNATAQAFWRAVGFREYCITMEAER
ncbi:MAG: GNAT family N-acetyltransferase [Planctomycetaceae bacterium]|nr:GNAT family N-acetyltransferase [Planctomycetaceae bacterium]